jgi:hypothetical protein
VAQWGQASADGTPRAPPVGADPAWLLVTVLPRAAQGPHTLVGGTHPHVTVSWAVKLVHPGLEEGVPAWAHADHAAGTYFSWKGVWGGAPGWMERHSPVWWGRGALLLKPS